LYTLLVFSVAFFELFFDALLVLGPGMFLYSSFLEQYRVAFLHVCVRYWVLAFHLARLDPVPLLQSPVDWGSPIGHSGLFEESKDQISLWELVTRVDHQAMHPMA